MDELVKSIRVGAVDFFGIIIPGILLIAMYIIGFFVPILFLIMDISNATIKWQELYAQNATLFAFILVIFSYVLGYILRLSSPDKLDKESAEIVIEEEKKLNQDFDDDGWPYNLKNKKEKYPYSRFREYLKKRGHLELLQELVTWCPDEELKEGAVWDDITHPDGTPIPKTKRSKSAVNEMKMKIRLQCPELSALIESKEGHIRLMAGTWAAFNFSIIPVILALVIVAAACFFHPWLKPHTVGYYPFFCFININLLLIMILSNIRIKQLFHYRRVSELFHIVQSAYLAQQFSEKAGEKSKQTG
ncbi:MAG: hypothetical protein ACM33V_06150 [Chloroflexota bacterium]|nr:hypothetical protein [Anaerolineales bacterium]